MSKIMKHNLIANKFGSHEKKTEYYSLITNLLTNF
jgi:hypothetical protein